MREKRRICKKETFDLHRWTEQQEEEEIGHGANVAVDNQEVLVVMVVPCTGDNLCPGYSQSHSCKRTNVEWHFQTNHTKVHHRTMMGSERLKRYMIQ